MTALSIFYAPDAYSLRGKVMGRQSAGAALMQAIADARLEGLWCYANSQAAASDCAQTLADMGAPRTGVA